MTDFFHRKAGIEQDEIKELAHGDPVHLKTADGQCHTLRVLGNAYLDDEDGQWKARAKSEGGTVYLIRVNHLRFHLPGEQCG